ncbi:SAM-dependent methyltransferase [Clostridium polyendosporum]|uniref:SAM-dependent methyltransferase n=1 Tax=Clostridium polyendosporum TaxID=69208 RepID=A0A919RX21_9CLOT|nr:class I SAM-dependent methyltransferase [Clostridium polyendosporum]GIM28055.1 SAM-dependent methyltransferase [Clostridium polyendosporum]
MDLSIRLKMIVNQVDECNSIVDVGTDHGYVPIYLVKNHICKKGVASDINNGPIEKAQINVTFEGLKDKISCRLGPGLKTVEKGEVEGVIIAGMGGNLTRDILLEDWEKVREYKFLILQPAQNPEVLREFLYNSEFEILDEDLCFEDNKFYELFKVKYSMNSYKIKIDSELDYEVSQILRKKHHPLLSKFIENKIEKYENIAEYIKENTESARLRKSQVVDKIKRLKEMM